MGISRSLRQRVRYYLDRQKGFVGTRGDIDVLDAFVKAAAALKQPRVLELGTKRLFADISTKHQSFVPHASEYLGSDIFEGDDVELVSDIHRLSSVAGEESFDIIISCSSFEHFKYPQLAALEIMKTLRVGGLVFIQTHQTFPIHGAPNDYFRFSRDALASCFGTKMGIEVVATDYEFPARIVSGEFRSARFMQSFLNTRLFAVKRDKTPDEFIFELDSD